MTRFQLCVRISQGGVVRIADWTVGPYRTAAGEEGWAVCDQHGLATFCDSAADAVDAFIGWLNGKVLPERWAPEPVRPSAGNIEVCDAWLAIIRAWAQRTADRILGGPSTATPLKNSYTLHAFGELRALQAAPDPKPWNPTPRPALVRVFATEALYGELRSTASVGAVLAALSRRMGAPVEGIYRIDDRAPVLNGYGAPPAVTRHLGDAIHRAEPG